MQIKSCKIKHSSILILKSIMDREKKTATKLAKEIGMDGQVLRNKLRGDRKFPVGEYIDILNHLGYKMNIIKETDIIK